MLSSQKNSLLSSFWNVTVGRCGNYRRKRTIVNTSYTQVQCACVHFFLNVNLNLASTHSQVCVSNFCKEERFLSFQMSALFVPHKLHHCLEKKSLSKSKKAFKLSKHLCNPRGAVAVYLFTFSRFGQRPYQEWPT